MVIRPDPGETTELLWEGPFRNPGDIAFDSKGYMLLVDPTTATVYESCSTSQPEYLLSCPVSDCLCIALDQNDNIFVSMGHYGEARVLAWSRNGTPIGSPILYGQITTRSSFPIAFGKGGVWGHGLYVLVNNVLMRFDAPLESPDSFTVIGTGFNEVAYADMEFDGDEALYISDQIGNRILRIAPSDKEGPVTTNVIAEPTPVNTDGLVTATVDDSETGGSNIQLAEYSIDRSGWHTMYASDGGFDEVTEEAFGAISAFSTPGVYEVCVRGRDVAGNDGEPDCTLLAVYDPDGGFVTGGGWIYSVAGAYVPDPTLEGKANFGFVSKYKKGADVPTGNTEFQFKTANLDFHSTSYDWLVVTGADYAQFKGAGTINGEGVYKFMLWIGDGDPDTFRIKIWEEDDTGNETVIYDNGLDQAIGGGAVVIHCN